MAGPNLARRTVRLLAFGREYARIRKERGLTDDDIRKGGVDPSAVWRWVNGEVRKPRRATVELLLTILEIHGPLRDELLDLLLNPDGPAWLRTYEGVLPEIYATYIGFEADARWLGNFELGHVPGLLQTDAYTVALLRSIPGVTEEHIRGQLEVRAQRQAVLAGPDPLHLHAVVDEGAVRRIVGGVEVMVAQLHALADEDRPNVTLQVLPFTAGAHPAGTGPFVTMRFRDPRAPAATFAETAGGLAIVDPDERYDDIWDSLVTMALNPEDSAAFIAAAAAGIE